MAQGIRECIVQSPRRVLLVEDHDFVRLSLRRYLEKHDDLCVCGEASSSSVALKLIENTKPNVILLDLSLGKDDGFSLLKAIRSRYREIPVLVLSMHNETIFGVDAIRHGAKGYVMKCNISEDLYQAIDTVISGEFYLSEFLRKKLTELPQDERAGVISRNSADSAQARQKDR